MVGGEATHIGAAIRHATYYLNRQKDRKKLLMIITDGAPSDIDVSSPNYLIYDTRRAVEDAGKNGIHTYCIGLDMDADRYISRIFGAKNYIVVDHVKHLPEKVLSLYARLTK
jgi:nitric oxide reductase activation protein